MLWASRKLAIKYKRRLGWLKPAAPLITCVLAIIVGGNSEIFNGCGFTRCDRPPATRALGPPTPHPHPSPTPTPSHAPTPHPHLRPHPNYPHPSRLTSSPSRCYDDSNTSYIPYVGEIPPGLPSGSIHLLDLSRAGAILSAAISCAVIGYMESIAIAKSLAAKHKYEVDAGQELTALGMANLLGSFTSSYPVTGSFSRSAVNNQVGAQTQLAGLLTGLLLLITLLVLTPVFEWLPKYALAAIVISSVTNLVDYNEAIHLWRVKKQDCLLWVVAFLGTLFLGVQNGLLLAVGVSLGLVIVESVRPQMLVLWRLPNTPIWRNIKQESHGQFVPGVMVVRVGASMYFANVAFIRDYISKMIKEFSEAADTTGMDATGRGSESGGTTHPDHPLGDAGPSDSGVVVSTDAGKWVPPEPIRYIVMEMTAVASIDSTALHMLEDMHRDLKTRDIRLAFSTVGNRVEKTLSRSGLTDKMGAHWIFPSVHVAVQHCIRHRMREAKPRKSDSGVDNNARAQVADSGRAEDGPAARSSSSSPPLAPAKTAPAMVEVQLADNGDNN